VFPVRYGQNLYYLAKSSLQSVTPPCGGELVPASRKRRQKGKTVSDETVKYSYWALLP
jgi:hypothetical protein